MAGNIDILEITVGWKKKNNRVKSKKYQICGDILNSI